MRTSAGGLAAGRGSVVVLGLLALVVVVGVVLLWPGERPRPDPLPGQELVDATVRGVQVLGPDTAVQDLLPGAVEVRLTVEVDATGELVAFTTTDDRGGGTYAVGQRIRLAVLPGPGEEPTYLVADFRRDRPLLLLSLLFAGAVVAFGRWSGLAAVGGRVVTVAVIRRFIVPAHASGRRQAPRPLIGRRSF